MRNHPSGVKSNLDVHLSAVELLKIGVIVDVPYLTNDAHLSPKLALNGVTHFGG